MGKSVWTLSETRSKDEGHVLHLRCGENVAVRSEPEILSTLDTAGTMDGLPFMPEMAKHCGGVFRVSKRADKTCVEGDSVRSMANAVFLADLRCDGRAHGGCQRMCTIFWKEAWLRRTDLGTAGQEKGVGPASISRSAGDSGSNGKYACQSTALQAATTPLPWGDPRQYMRDWLSGQLNPLEQIPMMFGHLSKKVSNALGVRFHATLRGQCSRTPLETLYLQPGELVELKGRDEILETLDSKGRNRGLEFSPEMVRFCGGRFRVLQRVQRIILEESGLMRELDNTVILEGVTCDGRYHRACPRNSYFLCREIWLRRVNSD